MLFTDEYLSDVLSRQRRAMAQEVQNCDGDYLLNVSESEYIRYLVDKYRVDCPVLLLDDADVDHADQSVDVSRNFLYGAYGSDRPVMKQGVKVTYRIPYTGEREVFRYKPSTSYVSGGPSADINNGYVTFTYVQPEPDADAIRRRMDDDRDSLVRHLVVSQRDIRAFNDGLEEEARQAVAARQKKVLADRDMVAKLGVPLKRRGDLPATYAAPSVRRKPAITAPRVSSTPFKPEPVLEEAEYQHILSVLSNMAHVMERSPSAFYTLDEEALRTHFLLHLNGHYEGNATGETFNSIGKTDILIRQDDRNVFIGECKYWEGPAAFPEIIDQILGYTSWRDTKTAILLFVRNRGFGAVVDQIPALVEGHANYRKSLGRWGETGFRYTFHHRDDSNRELTLTVLAFAVPTP